MSAATQPSDRMARVAPPCVPRVADALCPHPATVLSIRPEGPKVATFSLAFQEEEQQSRYLVQPGQFNMIYVTGVGEVPISVCAAPRKDRESATRSASPVGSLM